MKEVLIYILSYTTIITMIGILIFTWVKIDKEIKEVRKGIINQS